VSRKLRETQLQWRLCDQLQGRGCLVYASLIQRHAVWSAPVMRGFPDLVVVCGDTLALVEVKRRGGKVSPDQERWLSALAGVTKVRSGVVVGDTVESLLEQFDRLVGQKTDEGGTDDDC